MKLTNPATVPVYTISGSSTARPLPEWIQRKRKRSLKQDPDFANRVELLQDFEFEEASSCIRASQDGQWLVSTGTYKPQIHVHYLPHLSLSFARHTDVLNQSFQLLSSDYSKQLHLQTDRSLEFHTPQGCHYTTRLPRYGRDLQYDKRSAEALIPSVGVNADGNGEVFRLNLEVGRFMRSFDVDVGGDDFNSFGGGALQGGIATGAVNAASIAEESHNLHAFGTSLGSVEFWDPRSRSRVGVLPPPPDSQPDEFSPRLEISSLRFHPSGLSIGVGTSTGLIHLYDLRSPVPLLKKDQGYGYPIQSLNFLTSSTTSSRTAHLSSEPKILSADKRIIKLWDARDGSPWTSMEPAVDMNDVIWCPDSGMLLTANEGRQQHSFFIPQLGPAPKWCSFLDNLVEEMAEDSNDPGAGAAVGIGHKAGEVYDNYKFLSGPQLKALNLDHLVGTTGLLRPYMHGYFVAQQLYEEARLISNPELWQEQRQKSIREKIDKERESRIRGNKKLQVKVNRKLAQRTLEREEKNQRRKAKRAIERGSDAQQGEQLTDSMEARTQPKAQDVESSTEKTTLLTDPRFSALFQNEEYAVDEDSHEFRSLNASTKTQQSQTQSAGNGRKTSGLTAVEQEELDERKGSSSEFSDEEDEEDDVGLNTEVKSTRSRSPERQEVRGSRISDSNYRRRPKSKSERRKPQMVVASSRNRTRPSHRNPSESKSFGSLAGTLSKDRNVNVQRAQYPANPANGNLHGEKHGTFTVGTQNDQASRSKSRSSGGQRFSTGSQGRRSASGNTFRRI